MRANNRKNGKYAGTSKWSAKSVLALCLVVALAAALTIGGTLAFLKQKTGTVTNTFQAGNITYTLNLKANAQLVNHEDADVTMPNDILAEQTNTALAVDFAYTDHPTMAGYTFGGWYYDAACTEEYTDVDNGGKTITVKYGDGKDGNTDANKVEITLYANWTANPDTPYTVRHWVQKLNGGEEHNDNNFELHETDELTGTTDTEVTPAVKSYEGFTAPEAQTVTILGDGTTVVDYYYTRNSYTVTLKTGTGIASVTGADDYKYGAEVTINATLKEGYKWVNWTGEYNTNDQEYTFNMPANDVENTANGTPITYTVVYNKNGDDKAEITGSTANSTHTYNLPGNLNRNGYKRTGYTFIGWNTQPDGKGKSYADMESVMNLTSVDGDTVTLYAQWGAKSYVIRYHANGGAGSMVDQIIQYDVPTVLSKNQFTKSDYSFMGWALSANGEVAYPDEQTVVNLMESGTLDLYAIWAQNPHTVSFDYNGGSGSVKSQPFLNGKAYGPLPEYPTKTEMLFTGWYTQKSGGTRVKPETIANRTDDHTLYAQWESSPANDIVKNLTVKNNPDDNGDGVVDDIYLRFQCSSSFEKFNIPLNGLVVGQKYKITYTASNNASFGDSIDGYRNAVYGSYIVPDVNEYGGIITEAVAEDIIKRWNNRKEPDGNNDGSQAATNDAELQGPFNRSITFTATKNKMYWTWDMGLMQDGPYYDYNIMNIVLEPVAPTIKFGSKTILGDNGAKFASQSNGTYTSTFTFDGAGGCETVYYPITGLSQGLTYTIKFDHEFSGPLIHDTKTHSSPQYDYGCAITNTKPTKTGRYLKDLETWASGQFVKKTVDGKVDGVTLTFTATGDTAYWVWNMANCGDNDNTTTKVTVTQFSVKDSKNSETFYTASSKAGSAITLALDAHGELDFDFNIDVDELGAFANDMPTAGKDFILEFDPAEGYTMPESILVIIDGVDYVYTLEDLYAGTDDQGKDLYQLWIPGEMLNADGSLYIEALAVKVPEPETEPTEPETQPTEPETQPTEPETQPTEPETQPTEPETQPTEPETQPTEPVTEPTEPETEPTDPTEAATEPSVAATDPTETATLPPEETDPTEETEEVTE